MPSIVVVPDTAAHEAGEFHFKERVTALELLLKDKP